MDGSELKEIREKISCPQLGDNHYGEWGILTLHQRLTIKRMLDYIDMQEERIRSLQAETEAYKEVIKRIKEEFPNATSPFHNYGIEMYLDNLLKELGRE